jgi:hypothetical protein
LQELSSKGIIISFPDKTKEETPSKYNLASVVSCASKEPSKFTKLKAKIIYFSYLKPPCPLN